MYPPWIASMANTDVATIQLLARETPGAMFNDALRLAEKFENDAVVSLLRKCLAAWEHSNISALIDLCDESDRLQVFKEYVERHPVHHAARSSSGIAIIKPVIRAHAPELGGGLTPATPWPQFTSPSTERLPSKHMTAASMLRVREGAGVAGRC